MPDRDAPIRESDATHPGEEPAGVRRGAFEGRVAEAVVAVGLWARAIARVLVRSAGFAALYLVIAGVAVVLLAWWAGGGRVWLALVSVGALGSMHVAVTIGVAIVVGLLTSSREIQRSGLVAEVVRLGLKRREAVGNGDAGGEVSHAEFRRIVEKGFGEVRDQALSTSRRAGWLGRTLVRVVIVLIERRLLSAVDAAADPAERSVDGWVAVAFGAAADRVVADAVRASAWRLLAGVSGAAIVIVAAVVAAARSIP